MQGAYTYLLNGWTLNFFGDGDGNPSKYVVWYFRFLCPANVAGGWGLWLSAMLDRWTGRKSSVVGWKESELFFQRQLSRKGHEWQVQFKLEVIWQRGNRTLTRSVLHERFMDAEKIQRLLRENPWKPDHSNGWLIDLWKKMCGRKAHVQWVSDGMKVYKATYCLNALTAWSVAKIIISLVIVVLTTSSSNIIIIIIIIIIIMMESCNHRSSPAGPPAGWVHGKISSEWDQSGERKKLRCFRSNLFESISRQALWKFVRTDSFNGSY